MYIQLGFQALAFYALRYPETPWIFSKCYALQMLKEWSSSQICIEKYLIKLIHLWLNLAWYGQWWPILAWKQGCYVLDCVLVHFTCYFECIRVFTLMDRRSCVLSFLAFLRQLANCGTLETSRSRWSPSCWQRQFGSFCLELMIARKSDLGSNMAVTQVKQPKTKSLTLFQ